MKNLNRVIWGVLLIVFGLVLGLNSFGIAHINLFFDGWWTLFIIVPSVLGLFVPGDKTGDLIGLFIGILLLLGAQDLISFELIGKLIVPVILVLIGVMLIFNETVKANITKKVREVNPKDREEIIATFSSQKIDKSGEDFKAINLDAVFGSIDLNILKSKIKKEATIKSSSIFGSVHITVPKDVNVKMKSTPLFGSSYNFTEFKEENKNTIYIDAFCLFGSIEIRDEKELDD